MTLSCYGIHIGYTEMDRRREIIIKMDDDNGYKPIFYFEKIPFFFKIERLQTSRIYGC